MALHFCIQKFPSPSDTFGLLPLQIFIDHFSEIIGNLFQNNIWHLLMRVWIPFEIREWTVESPIEPWSVVFRSAAGRRIRVFGVFYAKGSMILVCLYSYCSLCELPLRWLFFAQKFLFLVICEPTWHKMSWETSKCNGCKAMWQQTCVRDWSCLLRRY